MSLIQRQISFDELLASGAAAIYPEKMLRKWFGEKAQISFEAALQNSGGLSKALFLLLRPQYLPTHLMHELAVDSCKLFLNKLIGDSAFIDFRLDKLLQAKIQWLGNEISMGELGLAQRTALGIRDDLANHPDLRARAAAQAVANALELDPALAIKNIFYGALEFFPDESFSAPFKTMLQRRLSESS